MEHGWIGEGSLSCIRSPGNLKNAKAQALPKWPALNFDKIPNGFDTFQWEKLELALACGWLAFFPWCKFCSGYWCCWGFPEQLGDKSCVGEELGKPDGAGQARALGTHRSLG